MSVVILICLRVAAKKRATHYAIAPGCADSEGDPSSLWRIVLAMLVAGGHVASNLGG
jgi:hypothetical protein